jgi:alcohol dehydrogenase class IV
MWFFQSPKIVFGEDALSHLEEIQGERAFLVTDARMVELGYTQEVVGRLAASGLDTRVFSEVEPEPSTDTVQRCAAEMGNFNPDWVVGLGGGSCLDAAKAAFFVYERPDVDLEALNPLEKYGLRKKARLITIPTTAGSGAEVSQASVLKDPRTNRKMELASYEIVADLTIVDPCLSSNMPPSLTADTGIDVLAHAIEVYNCSFANDFTDAVSLQAARLAFKYLPRAVKNGAQDPEAREKMANAATLAGLGICNANIALAHALSHSTGSVFPLPHGRLTGIYLPLVIEYNAKGGVGRYLDLTHALGLNVKGEEEAAVRLAGEMRALLTQINLPLSLSESGIRRQDFDEHLETLCSHAELDLGLVVSQRVPYREDLERLFEYAYEGKPVDF